MRRDVTIIVALAAVVLVPSMFTRDPWNPDEPRYTEVAREMIVTGSYAVPHLNGEVYPDKPAFFFWLVAGLMRLGFGFAAGRVLAALAATGTLLLVYGLGRRLYGREVGLMAALVTLTTMLFAWICKLGVLDPPLTFCVVAAIACGHRALEGGRRRGLWWLAADGAAGSGVLIKGPVAVAVPAIVLASYGIARRREAKGGGWWHLAGACLLLAVVAAGMAPSLIQGDAAYANEIVINQTARRFTRKASHSKPFYHFLATWPLYFLPWSLLVPLALVSAIRAARRGERESWLPALWLIAVLVFFSIPAGKRERYILPAIPAVGLLVARYGSRVAQGAVPWPRWHGWMWRATLILGAATAVAIGTAALAPARLAVRFEGSSQAGAELRDLLGPWRVAAALALGAFLIAAAFAAARHLREPSAERRRMVLAVAAVVAIPARAQCRTPPHGARGRRRRGHLAGGRSRRRARHRPRQVGPRPRRGRQAPARCRR